MDIGLLLFILFIALGAIVGFSLTRRFLNRPGLSMSDQLLICAIGGFLGTWVVAFMLLGLAHLLSLYSAH